MSISTGCITPPWNQVGQRLNHRKMAVNHQRPMRTHALPWATMANNPRHANPAYSESILVGPI